MTQKGPAKAFDQARVTVLLEVSPSEAFRAFVEDIDGWWRRGLKYRVAGKRHSLARALVGRATDVAQSALCRLSAGSQARDNSPWLASAERMARRQSCGEWARRAQ